MAPLGQNLCGARNAEGKICRKRAMDNGRCHLHGGLSTGPKEAAPGATRKHGIYDNYYTDEEKALNLRDKIGDLSGEIELVRIRIIRTIDAMKKWDETYKTKNDDVIESMGDLVSVTRTTGERVVDGSVVPVESEVKVRERPNFELILKGYIGRLESLEKSHKELQGSAMGGTAEEKARAILDAVDEMDDSVPEPGAGDE